MSRELDAEVAVRMGWKKLKNGWRSPHGHAFGRALKFNFSRHIEAAWTLIEFAKEQGVLLIVGWDKIGLCWSVVDGWSSPQWKVLGKAQSAPEAICLAFVAALKAAAPEKGR